MLQENVGLMWFLTLQSVMQSKRLKSFLMAMDVMCTLKQQGVLSLWNKGQSIYGQFRWCFTGCKWLLNREPLWSTVCLGKRLQLTGLLYQMQKVFSVFCFLGQAWASPIEMITQLSVCLSLCMSYITPNYVSVI